MQRAIQNINFVLADIGIYLLSSCFTIDRGMLSQVAHFDQHPPRGFMSQTHGGGTPPLSSVPSCFFESHHSSSQLSVLGNGVQDPCAHIFCCEKNWNRLGQNFVLFHLEARYTVVPFGRRKNIWRSNCYPSLLHRGS